MPPLSLYPRVLGAEFATLPAAVAALHALEHETTWAGTCDVERGASWVCRLIATLFRLPPQGSGQPIAVVFTPKPDGSETWRRRFQTGDFVSIQRRVAGGIEEQIGPARLLLIPTATPTGLTLSLARVTLFGVPLPRFFVPHVATRESAQHACYTFEVEAVLPLFGRLVRYSGWLKLQAGEKMS